MTVTFRMTTARSSGTARGVHAAAAKRAAMAMRFDIIADHAP
jgi:hypothetical protein